MIQNIVIYKHNKFNVELQADFSKETFWATQTQIAQLFGIDRTVATKHINNILKSKEIDGKRNVQKMHVANSDKPVAFYSLDIILAVGYRTNSSKAIVFRQWATKVLREYLINGVAINNDRIKNLHEKSLQDLNKKIKFIQEIINKRQLDKNEVDSLLSVIGDYANSWFTLDHFDKRDLSIQKSSKKTQKKFEYEFVRASIDKLKDSLIKKGEAGDLFGNERDGTFDGIIKTIYQTFDGVELYASLEEKAAHLLYFIIKDHPFSDGNKRIGAFLFVLFLDQNKILYRKNDEKKINDNALTAIVLLVAESNPNDKDQMVALITQLLK